MLPALVVTPHSSPWIPFAVLHAMLGEDAFDDAPRAATVARLYRATDAYTDLLFFDPDAHLLEAWVSRFVVDLNRHRDDRSANGVIKATDFDERPLYPPGAAPNDGARDELLRRYWDGFHAQIERLLAERSLRLLVDGHSMAPSGPALGPDRGRPRPALCLMTGGDARGEPVVGQRTSVDGARARALRELLERHYQPLLRATPAVEPRVALNTPWDVDELADIYSAPERRVRVPGFGVEINEGLFLDGDGRPQPGRVRALNRAFRSFLRDALELF